MVITTASDPNGSRSQALEFASLLYGALQISNVNFEFLLEY